MPSQRIAIVGTGPAALMAADRLCSSGFSVTLFEKRGGVAWKLFVAGRSGLNITNALTLETFAQQYSGPSDHWHRCLTQFSNQDWIRFIEEALGERTFLGTSGRYFVETMHAAKLVRAWRRRLEELGAAFQLGHELEDFKPKGRQWGLRFNKGAEQDFDRVLLCLGGGSYEAQEGPLRWVQCLERKGLRLVPFSPVNTGYHIAWTPGMIAEADGLPLKNIVFRNAKGSRKGDLVVTEYGLEGTPVYTLGEPGPATIDLKPDLSLEAIRHKLLRSQENISLIRRAQKHLRLNKAAMALLFHMGKPEWRTSLDAFAEGIKNFPVDLLKPRPLSESISARGGVAWDNLDAGLQLKAFPGIWLAGEMIDWEAPTGGFLIQGAVSQGAFAAAAIKSDLSSIY